MFARQLNIRNEVNTVIKYSDFPKVQNDFKQNPVLHYFNETRKEYVLALPILDRIKNKQLVLIGYKLNKGLC